MFRGQLESIEEDSAGIKLGNPLLIGLSEQRGHFVAESPEGIVIKGNSITLAYVFPPKGYTNGGVDDWLKNTFAMTAPRTSFLIYYSSNSFYESS